MSLQPIVLANYATADHVAILTLQSMLGWSGRGYVAIPTLQSMDLAHVAVLTLQSMGCVELKMN
jgi:hypothetical protein